MAILSTLPALVRGQSWLMQPPVSTVGLASFLQPIGFIGYKSMCVDIVTQYPHKHHATFTLFPKIKDPWFYKKKLRSFLAVSAGFDASHLGSHAVSLVLHMLLSLVLRMLPLSDPFFYCDLSKTTSNWRSSSKVNTSDIFVNNRKIVRTDLPFGSTALVSGSVTKRKFSLAINRCYLISPFYFECK